MVLMPNVKVDWGKCAGAAVCVAVCPTNVFEMQSLEEHPNTPKSAPVREKDCILCHACDTQCPTGAITVKE